MLRQDRTVGPEGWRLGLAVTKKTGSAVQRNRVKRVLREFFRLHRALMPDAVDVVAVPKRHLKPERVTLAFVIRELLPVLMEFRVLQAGGRAGLHGPEAALPRADPSGTTLTDEARPDTAREAETGVQ